MIPSLIYIILCIIGIMYYIYIYIILSLKREAVFENKIIYHGAKFYLIESAGEGDLKMGLDM